MGDHASYKREGALQDEKGGCAEKRGGEGPSRSEEADRRELKDVAHLDKGNL